MTLKIAHISDIHFFHFNKSLLQFFGKRFLANFNAFFTRTNSLDQNLAYQVLDFLKKEGVTKLIISGDFTSSSSLQEFKMMQDYVKKAKNLGFTIFTLPGNHDAYTKNAHKNQLFFSHLKNLVSFTGDTSHNLIDDHVAAYKLTDPWWVLLIDCSFPTALHKSTGVFSKAVEESLIDILKAIPESAEITVVCHYPFERFKFPKAHLERGSHLTKILSDDKRIRIYLHGHRHVHRIEQIGNITVADSGSISLKKASSLNLLEYTDKKCEINQYQHIHGDWRKTDVRETITTLV